MSQNESRGLAAVAIAISVVSLGASGAAFAFSPERDRNLEPASRVTQAAQGTTATSIVQAAAPSVALPPPVKEKASTEPAKRAEPATSAAPETELVVKRFVVTSGVERREPLATGEPMALNGKPVYAFAELQNTRGEEQELSVVFENKDANRRVGFATLKVPAKVPRHRTWANTRNIAEPGTWEAVLLSANGVELSRASFEVTPRSERSDAL